ncbi:hypothetical protein [Nocardioides sp.]|uniref:hypothetical protein n=1 Tax=Nocardioides sp. TaxID=35761 RepID=UPI0019ACFC5A|nr:hypothetical protein [Nocardioides sp.]MBC7275023.1 hypothetical protein [Nocardioides sp.]
METTARNRTIGGIVIGAIILILLLVLFSCTVTPGNLQGYGEYNYHRDAKGYFLSVPVSKDKQVPPEWMCHPKEGDVRTLTCDIRIDGAQGANADNLTKQEVEDLVREEVERLENTPQVEPMQGADRPGSDLASNLPNWIMAGVALATFGWLLFTQRDHLPALITGVRRLRARLRRWLAIRVLRSVGAGPGPLRHLRGWRPVRQRS